MEITATLQRAKINIESEENVFFQCPVCTKGVPFNRDVQEKYERGGVGHLCQECNSYIGLLSCSKCHSIHLLDDSVWSSLSIENPFICTNCSVPLLPKKQSLNSYSISMEVIERELLRNYSNLRDESDFILVAKHFLEKHKQEELARYHNSTFQKLELSKKYFEELSSIEPCSNFKLYNNSSLSELENHLSSRDTFREIDKLIFIQIISLFAVIESLLHEVNTALNLGYQEWEVGDNLINNLGNSFISLKQQFEIISQDWKFKYLKSLRNVLTHRRVPTLASNVRYELPDRIPFRPFAIKGSSTLYLPDKPSAKIGTETFVNKYELKATIETLIFYVEDIVKDCYAAMTKDLNNM